MKCKNVHSPHVRKEGGGEGRETLKLIPLSSLPPSLVGWPLWSSTSGSREEWELLHLDSPPSLSILAEERKGREERKGGREGEREGRIFAKNFGWLPWLACLHVCLLPPPACSAVFVATFLPSPSLTSIIDSELLHPKYYRLANA